MLLDRATTSGWNAAEHDLTSARPPAGIPVPAYGGRSIPNLVVSIANTGPLPNAEGLAPPLASDVDPFRVAPPEGPVVLIIIDGLGWKAYRRWLDETSAPWALDWASGSVPLSTVFPTTTTAALVSLSAGVPPAHHGILGYRLWMPAWKVVADMLRFAPAGSDERDTLGGTPFDRRAVAGAPTLFQRGLRGTVLSRDVFQGTRFTQLLYEGAEYVPYSTRADMARTLLEVLRRTRPPPVLFVYWDELDHAGHVRGPDSFLIAEEIESLHAALSHVARRIERSLSRRVTVVVTADHGVVAADPSAQLRLDASPELTSMLVTRPGGDRRGPYLAPRPEVNDQLQQALKSRSLPGTKFVPMDQASAMGLFGPPPHHPEMAERLGSLLVLPPVPGTITYRPPDARGPVHFLLGAHGGIDAEEFLVPRIAGSLAHLTDTEKR